jgi:general secretion pathway protein H
VTTLTSAISTDPQGPRGFTLLEVIVVMVIIGILTAIAMPAIQAGSRQAAVRRSVRAFISAARQASARAVSTRRPTALIIWPDDGAFGVEGVETRVDLPDFAEFGEITGGSEAEADDEIRFNFFPTGSSVGGSVKIEFTPSDTRQAYTLILDPLIGRVRIEEGS